MDLLMMGWRGALKAVDLSLEKIETIGTHPPDTDERLNLRMQGAESFKRETRTELSKLNAEEAAFVEGFLGLTRDKHEPIPLHQVMRDMVRVIDSLNRDRSFELAEAVQGALGWMNTIVEKLREYGHDDWWITPSEAWDSGWNGDDTPLTFGGAARSYWCSACGRDVPAEHRENCPHREDRDA